VARGGTASADIGGGLAVRMRDRRRRRMRRKSLGGEGRHQHHEEEAAEVKDDGVA
jgi:hypothetical protein